MNRREFLEMPGLALAAAPLVSRQRPLPRSEFDYVDWSWQRWRELTGESKLSFRALKPDKRSSSSSAIQHRLSHRPPGRRDGRLTGRSSTCSWYAARQKGGSEPQARR